MDQKCRNKEKMKHGVPALSCYFIITKRTCNNTFKYRIFKYGHAATNFNTLEEAKADAEKHIPSRVSFIKINENRTKWAYRKDNGTQFKIKIKRTNDNTFRYRIIKNVFSGSGFETRKEAIKACEKYTNWLL